MAEHMFFVSHIIGSGTGWTQSKKIKLRIHNKSKIRHNWRNIEKLNHTEHEIRATILARHSEHCGPRPKISQLQNLKIRQ